MSQTWILFNNLYSFCDWELQLCSPHWDTQYWCFGLAKKAFLFTIFLIINVQPWNGRNLDTYYNLHSFCYWHYNHVLHIGIHDMDALDLQEVLFFPPLSLKLVFICGMRQTWILIIISIFLLLGTTIMFSSLG